MGNFPEVLNFNWLFLKLNRFICQLAVGSPRSLLGDTPTLVDSSDSEGIVGHDYSTPKLFRN